jgi:hypothetical protein
MIDRARRYAPRPYEIVVLSDHGQTQGATFQQRNGYGLDDLVARSSACRVDGREAGDEHAGAVGQALDEAMPGARAQQKPGDDSEHVGADTVVLGSGNLGLVYLMELDRRLTLEEIEQRHPQLIPALREHPHIGFIVVQSAEGPLVLGAGGRRRLRDGHVEGMDPLGSFSPNAAGHLARAAAFRHAPDILVNSFYDPVLEEGCAFEELISFHGGMGGPQTRPFLLHPVRLALPDAPLVGAAAVNELLRSWRDQAGEQLQAADGMRLDDASRPAPIASTNAR